jgi:SAM-dependent methyltransferase
VVEKKGQSAMSTTGTASHWASGDAYEPYVGRWSREVAPVFLAWLAVPAEARWLDVGCGTGALSATLLKAGRPAKVVAIDQSAAFVTYARAHVTDPRARFVIGNARALPVPSATFDAVVAGLVLNHVPEPAVAVAEMARAASPGGVVAAYVWDYADGMHLMRRFWDVATALDPAARELDEGRRSSSICQPDALADLFGNAALHDVQTRAIDIPTVFRDFDDYWTPFLGGQGPAPAYTVALSDTRREALRDRLRTELPIDADGSIRLTARAWAVRGERR